jgi:stearoyl-CoA desaturase (delta-9 desaturase)
LGETPFDDKHTPRDHLVTALVTIGEGYHNFHHQFPMDYRNAIKWYQYDPTKWFIWVCQELGLASHLKVQPFLAEFVDLCELTHPVDVPRQ